MRVSLSVHWRQQTVTNTFKKRKRVADGAVAAFGATNWHSLRASPIGVPDEHGVACPDG